MRLDGHLLSSILIIITLCGLVLRLDGHMLSSMLIIITLCGPRSERPRFEVRLTLAVFFADNYNTMWTAFREASF